MIRRRAAALWGACLLGVATSLAAVGAATAEEPLAAGATYVGLGGVLSTSHDTDPSGRLTGLHLLPHVGWVVTDEAGPGWLRGNLELLAEPTLVHLRDDTHSATVVGVSALARWIFTGTARIRPYFEAGAGALLGETALFQTDCEVNFLLQAGPGLLVFLTDRAVLTVGYRFQHISNGGVCSSFNEGINSSALYLGVSYLLP